MLWSGETKVELFGIGCIRRVGGGEMLSTTFPSPSLSHNTEDGLLVGLPA